MKYLIGIDEAGRGPLAGPVSVGVVMVSQDFDWSLIPGVGDSKKVTPKNREAIFRRAQALQKTGQLDFSVSLVSAKIIDKQGIVSAIKLAMSRALKKIHVTPENCTVKLDGSLKAPKEYVNQETIIKGDSKELVIGLASIMAKVTRDRYMVKISAKPEFTTYNFAVHKGYGTQAHKKAILKNGVTAIHRLTFVKI
jgi:ribonuclease HII